MKHNSVNIRATAALSANAAVAAARAIIAITNCFFIVSFLSKNQLIRHIGWKRPMYRTDAPRAEGVSPTQP